MFRSASLFIGTSFTVAVFTIFATSNVDSIVGIPHKIYSTQRISIHNKKPISLLNAPICTHGMQRTWWPEAGTIIVTELYYKYALKWWYHLYKKKLKQERRSKRWNTFSGLEISIRRPTVNTLDLSAPPPPPPPHTHTHTQIHKLQKQGVQSTTSPLSP